MLDTNPAPSPDTAWNPWAATADAPWTLVHAGHLHRRAGFGADWTQLQATLRDGPTATIERLLRPDSADIDAFNRDQDTYETTASGVAQPPPALRAWWLRRMIETPRPLLEKMTLFWHGFFGVSAGRAQDPTIALQHVRTLRKHALGRFDEMLRQVLAQPALYAANGAARNPKAKPNLTFAGRLLENYTLGTGQRGMGFQPMIPHQAAAAPLHTSASHFTDQDITEVARAFTGWTVRRRELVFVEHDHDPGPRTVLGTTGPLNRDDVTTILLQHPALATHIVRRLYRFLVAEDNDPADDLLQPLADSFAKDFDIARVVETILRSKIFYSDTAYRRRIKCPAEFAVGLLRTMESTAPGIQLGGELAALGQDLYQPPTFKGWHGGRAWINPATLIGRANLAFAILSGSGVYKEKVALPALAQRHGFKTPEQATAFLAELLLQNDVSEPVRDTVTAVLDDKTAPGLGERMKQVASLIVSLPEFQLS